MSGQLLHAKSAKEVKPKHTHVVFTFAQGDELRYVDPRTFGELYVSVPPPEGAEVEISKFARLSIGARDCCFAVRSPSSRTWASTPSRIRSAGTGSPQSCAVARRH